MTPPHYLDWFKASLGFTMPFKQPLGWSEIKVAFQPLHNKKQEKILFCLVSIPREQIDMCGKSTV